MADRWRKWTSGSGAEDVHQAGIGCGDPRPADCASRRRLDLQLAAAGRHVSTRNCLALRRPTDRRSHVLAVLVRPIRILKSICRRPLPAPRARLPRSSLVASSCSCGGASSSVSAGREQHLAPCGGSVAAQCGSLRVHANTLSVDIATPHPAEIDNSQRRWPDCGDSLSGIVQREAPAAAQQFAGPMPRRPYHNWSRSQFRGGSQCLD